ncbi:hypothetical protein KM176_16465 [Pseudooceanicola sp. CBS1P-1]|uniref:Uncharacterized protein n=1 Tax=Pseudooceanicola albus TaxID=2692189 RepID=A0A6L7G5F5_9RHOB|nr:MULTISPECIES: hypothetical protein [Pseudooceanicola]MBT9385469.1 hypothetical protein [Pseudooceanicola endophyticus]MXN19119.1 hypothetical protein [Pseudooceanicola albus]
MAEIRRIVRADPKSNFRQVGESGGMTFAALADIAKTAYEQFAPGVAEMDRQKTTEEWSQYARQQMGNNRATFSYPGVPGGDGTSSKLLGLIDRTEGGGGYSTLFGNSQAPGGKFAGVDVSKMTIGEAKKFAAPDGEYGQWVKGQVGRVATPMGRGQVVGTTLGAAASQLGLPDTTPFNAATQGAIIDHLARQATAGPLTLEGKMARLRQTWEGLKNVSDEDLAAAVQEMSGGGGQPPAQEPVLVKTRDGAVEPRLYSPLSGPMLRAHNAAAASAYLAEMNNAAGQDFAAFATQFPLDPEGFRQAAQGYVDQAVKGAPEQMRADLRLNLEREMQQSYIGMVEEKQSDTRKRADNASAALVDRWSTQYSEALASGNNEAAQAARSRLEDLLVNREALPGIGWTRAQSENVILGSIKGAQKIENTRATAYKTEIGKKLDGVISAAENGQHAADEALLDDKGVWSLQPDKAREAAAKIQLRDAMPDFRSMLPAERKAIIEGEQQRTLHYGYEPDLLKAMKSVDTSMTAALDKDPIQYFSDFMPDDQKPPTLPSDMSDPGATIAAMTARRDYAKKMQAEGYTAVPIFLSDAEVKLLTPHFADGADPAAKAALAKLFVAGFKEDAGAALKEVKADDVTQHVGGLMAAGVGDDLAQKALVGQQMIEQGQVMLPPKAASVASISPEIVDALGPAAYAMGATLKTAKALYAVDAKGVDPTSDDAKKLMASSLQQALGFEQRRSGRYGTTATGGVQEVNGHQTLLPPGISPKDVEAGIKQAVDQILPGRGAPPIAGREVGASRSIPGDPDLWGGLNGSTPSYNGQPISMRQLQSAKFVPITDATGQILDGLYRIEVMGGTDVENEAGNVFIFDMRKLAERGR